MQRSLTTRTKKLVAIALILTACATPLAIGVAVALDPLRQRPSNEWVAVASLRDLQIAAAPQRVPVLVARRDTWTTLPDRLVGEVFLRRTGDREVAVLQTLYHLCADVEFNPATREFVVPCWNDVHFDIDGRRLHPKDERGNVRRARFRLDGDTVLVNVPDVTRIDG